MEIQQFRRNIKRWFVKAQSRAEAGMADRWIPAFSAAIYVGVLARFALSNYQENNLGPNVARYANVFLNAKDGNLIDLSANNVDHSILELHGTFGTLPLSLFSYFLEPVQTLLLIQAIAVGITVVPIWIFARQVVQLRISAAFALILAFMLHPVTHELVVSDFSPEALALPFFVGLAYTSATHKWSYYWLCVIVILLLRADLGLVVAVWGFVLMRDGESSRGVRSAALGAGWALASLLVLQPILGVDEFSWSLNLFEQANIDLVVLLLAPLLFLPSLSLKFLFPAIPLGAMYLVTSGPILYGDPMPALLGFSIVATGYSFKRLGKLGVNRVFNDPRLIAAFVFATIVFYVSVSPLSPYAKPWQWGSDTKSDAVAAAIEQIPDEYVVRSSQSALANLVGNVNYVEFDSDLDRISAVAATRGNVDGVLIVIEDFEDDTVFGVEFESQIATLGFSEAYNNSGVVLYLSGA